MTDSMKLADEARTAEEREREEWAEAGRMRVRLIRQLILSVLFGYTGIPALWRSTKFYGFFVLFLFLVSLMLTVLLNWWYLFIPVGALWLVDVLTMITRVQIYLRGLKNHRKNSER